MREARQRGRRVDPMVKHESFSEGHGRLDWWKRSVFGSVMVVISAAGVAYYGHAAGVARWGSILAVVALASLVGGAGAAVLERRLGRLVSRDASSRQAGFSLSLASALTLVGVLGSERVKWAVLTVCLMVMSAIAANAAVHYHYTSAEVSDPLA